MNTLTKSKTVSVLPLIAFGLFVWITIMNDLEPDETQQQKPRTLTFEEVVVQDENGTYQLHPKRLQKLQRDIENLKYAEQYVLRTRNNGWFPCLSCPFRDSIYLYKNEVWKYGITINGEGGRYGNQLEAQGLKYLNQYIGTIEECMIEERKKIIKYPLLKENLQRKNQ